MVIAVRPTPPSSNPACSFPALGFPENSRLKHAQRVARSCRSQIHKPELLHEHVERHPFRTTKGPLAPSAQMNSQPVSHKAIDFPKRLARITIPEIVRPSQKMTIQFKDHVGNRFEAHGRACHLPQFCPLPCQGLFRGHHIQVSPCFPEEVSVIAECVPQKIQTGPCFPQINHPRFISVNLQTQPFLKVRFYPLNQLCPLVSRHDYKVSRPRKPPPRPLSEPGVNLSAHRAPIIQPLV